MDRAAYVENLVKRYGDVLALDGITFEVRWGEVSACWAPTGLGRPLP